MTAPRHRPLTPAMRDALRKARGEPLRRVHDDKPGRPSWPAPPSTLAALIRHGLLTRTAIISRKGYPVDVWTITDAGRDALKPRVVVRRAPVLCLHIAGTSTRMMQLGAWVDVRMPEPEPVQLAA